MHHCGHRAPLQMLEGMFEGTFTEVLARTRSASTHLEIAGSPFCIDKPQLNPIWALYKILNADLRAQKVVLF